MRAVFGGSLAGARKIDGQSLPSARSKTEARQNQQVEPAKSVRASAGTGGNRIHFRDLALMAWPAKTENHLAFYGRVDVRTARRWLADDSEPPAEMLGVILAEIMRRFHQRA